MLRRRIFAPTAGDNLLWRLYRGKEGDLLVVAARDDRPLFGVICWQSQTIELTGGTVGLLSRQSGKLIVQGDTTWKPLIGGAR